MQGGLGGWQLYLERALEVSWQGWWTVAARKHKVRVRLGIVGWEYASHVALLQFMTPHPTLAWGVQIG